MSWCSSIILVLMRRVCDLTQQWPQERTILYWYGVERMSYNDIGRSRRWESWQAELVYNGIFVVISCQYHQTNWSTSWSGSIRISQRSRPEVLNTPIDVTCQRCLPIWNCGLPSMTIGMATVAFLLSLLSLYLLSDAGAEEEFVLL